MQHRKELLKQNFKDWKLILNDDQWEHIIAENDPEDGKRQQKVMDRRTRMLGAHRNALGTFHREQNSQIATAVVDATLLFGCEVRGFSNKEEKDYEALWSRVVCGSRVIEEEIWNGTKNSGRPEDFLQNEADSGSHSNSSVKLPRQSGQAAR